MTSSFQIVANTSNNSIADYSISFGINTQYNTENQVMAQKWLMYEG